MNREPQIDTLKTQPGTYALVLYCRISRKVKVGKRGFISLIPGYYIYVGSAFGPGGLRARVQRHIRKSTKKHWHIDYIKWFTRPLEIWYSYNPMIREHQWAEIFNRSKQTRILMKGFGSSDCTCTTHLFFQKTRPQSRIFVKKVQAAIKECDQIYILKLETADNQ